MTDKVRAPRGAQENLQLGPREEFGGPAQPNSEVILGSNL